MSIPIECECGFADKVPDKWAGKRVKCKCGRKILVPQPAATAANKPASEQKARVDSAKQLPAGSTNKIPTDKTSSKKVESQKLPAKKKIDAEKKSSDDLSELVSGDLPTELKKPKPAIAKPKAKSDALDVVEEFEELEELEELEEFPSGDGLDNLEELDDLDDLDDFDMREADDLDMTEPTVKKPEKKLPEKRLPAKQTAAAKPNPKPEVQQRAKPKTEPTKSAPDKPAPDKAALGKPALGKPEQPKSDVKSEQTKPTSEKPAKPIAKPTPKPVEGKDKKSEPPKETRSSKENVQKNRENVKPVGKTSNEPVAKEPVAATASKNATAERIAIPSVEAAPVVDREDAPPPPAHAPAMVKADATEVQLALELDKPTIVESGAPKLSVGSSGGASLSGRQKAKLKADIIRWVVMTLVVIVASAFFGVIFLIGSLLNRFDTPAVITEDEKQIEESAETMLVPGADSTPTVVDDDKKEDDKAVTDEKDTKESKPDETPTKSPPAE